METYLYSLLSKADQLYSLVLTDKSMCDYKLFTVPEGLDIEALIPVTTANVQLAVIHFIKIVELKRNILDNPIAENIRTYEILKRNGKTLEKSLVVYFISNNMSRNADIVKNLTNCLDNEYINLTERGMHNGY